VYLVDGRDRAPEPKPDKIETRLPASGVAHVKHKLRDGRSISFDLDMDAIRAEVRAAGFDPDHFTISELRPAEDGRAFYPVLDVYRMEAQPDLAQPSLAPASEPPVIHVHVPEQAAPVVHVHVPEQPAPVVNVPDQGPHSVEIERDAQGLVKRLTRKGS
jgi:hypothetical protein